MKPVGAILLAFAVAAATASAVDVATRTTSTCLAASQPGMDKAKRCTVNFTDIVKLQCPTSVTGGEWFKGNVTVNSNLCNGDSSGSCAYAGEMDGLWYSDIGLYYCSSNSADRQFYFVNLTLLAPPRIDDPPRLYINTCSPRDQANSTCTTNPLVGYDNVAVTISASFYSPYLPVSVEIRHNGSLLNCTAPKFSYYCTLHQTSTSVSISLDRNHFIDGRSDPGTYTFNISNAAGYNISETELFLICAPSTPPQGLTTDTVLSLTVNQPTNLTCRVYAELGVTMYMCLITANTTADDVKRDFMSYLDSCAQCEGNNCPPIDKMVIRPDWQFYQVRDYHAPCQAYAMTAVVPSVAPHDDGMKLLCAWGDDTPNSFAGYALQTLDIATPPGPNLKVIIGGSVGGSVGVIGLVVIIGSLLVLVWYRGGPRPVPPPEPRPVRRPRLRRRLDDRRPLQRPIESSEGPESSDDASDVRPLNLGPPPPNYSAINASVPGEPNPLTGFHNPNSGYVSEFPPLTEVSLSSDTGDESARPV